MTAAVGGEENTDGCILYLPLPTPERARALCLGTDGGRGLGGAGIGELGTASAFVAVCGARSGARLHAPRPGDADRVASIEGTLAEVRMGRGREGEGLNDGARASERASERAIV